LLIASVPATDVLAGTYVDGWHDIAYGGDYCTFGEKPELRSFGVARAGRNISSANHNTVYLPCTAGPGIGGSC